MITELEQSEFYKCRSIVNGKGQVDTIAVVEEMIPVVYFGEIQDDWVSLNC